MSGNATIDVQVACSDQETPDAAEIQAWVQRALAESGLALGPEAEVSVRVVDTEEIQTLNRDYRDQDKATNVLSFPADELAGLPPDEARHLGDIVVCAEVVSREARSQGKPISDHWAHLLVHGTLHLAGYDHQDEAEATVMEGLEQRILGQYGLPDPYGESS